jgi:hypothetical protein
MNTTVDMTLDSVRELDHREMDGLDVTLVWYEQEDYASVVVVDSKAGDVFELVLGAGDSPLDVFNHPYAYAALRGLEYGSRVAHDELALTN